MTSIPRLTARRVAPSLYRGVVAAARAPALYRDLRVADTIEGRYEMVVLHAALLLSRLRRSDPDAAKLSQAVLDFMAADFDRSMRELGVGDLSVGRYMKRLGEGFYGRAAVYEAALGAGDAEALGAALLRNVYGGIDPGGPILARIALYTQAQAQHLDAQPIAALAQGRVAFLSLEEDAK